MVEHKRQIHHRADGNRVIYNNHALLHCADPENPTLRLVDDGKREQRSASAVIGQRERAAFHFVRL